MTLIFNGVTADCYQVEIRITDSLQKVLARIELSPEKARIFRDQLNESIDVADGLKIKPATMTRWNPAGGNPVVPRD